ncbi:MAG: DUF5683 domain-containing protein [Bacteroidia bacterium]
MLNNKIRLTLKSRLFLTYRIALLFIIHNVNAQDTLTSTINKIESDTALTQKNDTLNITHSPKKAAIMSAVLPGLGQIYNRKYWKVPIIYAGLGTLGYFITFNNAQYRLYRNAYLAKIDDDPLTVDQYPFASADGLLQQLNQYRRTRDILIAGAVIVYALNVIDASVDAHLFEFDVSDDLSIRFEPNFFTNFTYGYTQKNITLKICF